VSHLPLNERARLAGDGTVRLLRKTKDQQRIRDWSECIAQFMHEYHQELIHVAVGR
jgi:hypothetical protein